jgi:eukaryotic-like serine/threonine-protein kinase
MPSKQRPIPVVPDHEVLRKIGGGSYGEVWLARAVTGALRAVKIVYREDFDDERGFEREFEGILKFEPMSRDHPGLVNILHVGRSPDGISFYYYVMELGDDLTSGQEINPVEYEPRTLRADHAEAKQVRWETSECIDVGLRLAEALHHLHERGLAHRDVKPANIIFVNGRAKLADIGLVAVRDQRTFVGTEGFVPPEGPGSAQADIYSLGKVLYEIATGKDRMDFPELPDELPSGAERKRWLELNRIICDVCEPQISKRGITTAAELADALWRLQHGKRRRRTGTSVWLTTLMLAGFAAWGSWVIVKDSPWLARLWPKTASRVVAPPLGMLRVFSAPEGAKVTDADEAFVGRTNTPILTAQVGSEFYFTMRKKGFRERVLRGKVPASAVNEPWLLSGTLENFSPPEIGQPWVDHLGQNYQAQAKEHHSLTSITKLAWVQFLKSTKRTQEPTEYFWSPQNGVDTEIALVTAADANAFCGWLLAGAIKAGYLTEDHEVIANPEVAFDHPGLTENARKNALKPLRVTVKDVAFATLALTSRPPGVEVFMNGRPIGSTKGTLFIPKVRPGPLELAYVLEGYKPLKKQLVVDDGQTVVENVMLERNQGVVFGKPWENGIQMRFAPVGPDLMASIWETRVADFELFVRETGRKAPRLPDYPQRPNFPVVHVTREDAQAFCGWLTQRERKDEWIAQTHEYRLPTDHEWSKLVGLDDEPGMSPGWLDARKQKVFPWGNAEFADRIVGNFADITASRTPGVVPDQTIQGYDDGFANAAPVGSFPPNSYGLYDLSGNVQEWMADDYSKIGSNQLGVLRGGGWNTYQLENLYSGARNAVPPTFQDWIYGFRIVLAKVPPQPVKPSN